MKVAVRRRKRNNHSKATRTTRRRKAAEVDAHRSTRGGQAHACDFGSGRRVSARDVGSSADTGGGVVLRQWVHDPSSDRPWDPCRWRNGPRSNRWVVHKGLQFRFRNVFERTDLLQRALQGLPGASLRSWYCDFRGISLWSRSFQKALRHRTSLEEPAGQ